MLLSFRLYGQENVRNNAPPNYSRLKTTVRRLLGQTIRTRNFRALNEIVERGTETKSQQGRKASVEREVEKAISGRNLTVFARRLMLFQS